MGSTTTTTTRTRINRRAFLVVTGAGAAVVAVSAAGLALRPGLLRTPRRPLQALDEASFSVLAAVADRICPGGEGLPSAWDIQVPEEVDAFLATAHPAVATDLMMGMALLENALPGLLLDGRAQTFTGSSPEQQDQTLHRMATSGIALRKTLYKGLLGLVAATYWGNAAILPKVGYRPLDFTGWSPEPSP